MKALDNLLIMLSTKIREIKKIESEEANGLKAECSADSRLVERKER